MWSRILPKNNTSDTQNIRKYSDVPQWAETDIDRLSARGYLDEYKGAAIGVDEKVSVDELKKMTDISDAIYNTVKPSQSFYGYVNNKDFRNADIGDSYYVDLFKGAVVQTNGTWSYNQDMSKKIYDIEISSMTDIMYGNTEYEGGSAEKRIHDFLVCVKENQDKDYYSDTSVYFNEIAGAEDLSALIEVTNKIYKETGFSTLFHVLASKDSASGHIYPTIEIKSSALLGCPFLYSAYSKEYREPYIEEIKKYVKSIGVNATDDDIEKLIQLQSGFADKELEVENYAYAKSLRTTFDSANYSKEAFNNEMDAIVAENPDLDSNGVYRDEPYTAVTKDAADSMFRSVRLTDVLDTLGYYNYDMVLADQGTNFMTYSELAQSPDYLTALKLNCILNFEETSGLAFNQEQADLFDKISSIAEAVMQGLSVDSTPVGLPTDSLIASDPDGYLNYRNLNLLHDFLPSAIEKINNIVTVIGHDTDLPEPVIKTDEEGGGIQQNLCNIAKNYMEIQILKCSDQTKFRSSMQDMDYDTVNAMYYPSLNAINIYAGMLQYPVYDKDADRATNLGAIGFFIAHEIGHAFDSTGAKYDKYGNLNNWWTENDLQDFSNLMTKFDDYYKKFEVVNGVVQETGLTINENMADVAGLQCIMDVIGDDKAAQKEALESFAKQFSELGTETAITGNAAYDVHSSNQVRVNACVSLLDQFYDIYGVTEGDAMYIAPEDRLRIW